MLSMKRTSTPAETLPGSTQKENMSSRWAAMFPGRPFNSEPGGESLHVWPSAASSGGVWKGVAHYPMNFDNSGGTVLESVLKRETF